MEKTPVYKSVTFQCPHCQVIAQQQWFDVRSAGDTINAIIRHFFFDYRSRINEYEQTAITSFLKELTPRLIRDMQSYIPDTFSVATCASCNDISLWIEKEFVYPKKTSLPPPNNDIDENIKALYQEAATIFIDSPRGATALLRLALQILLKQVGKSGENINNDIKELVSEGLSPKIQQALDLLRVVGNNAVHPGQINIDDNSEIAFKLFHVLNFIADEMLTKPKELELLYSNVIPEETKKHIKQRDRT